MIVAILIVGSLGAGYLAGNSAQRTVTSTSTLTSTSITTSSETTTSTETVTSTSVTTATETSTSMETSTSTSITTATQTTTTTSEVILPAGCLPDQSYGYSYETLVAGTSSPATICVQVYWFNSTSPMVLNTTSLLQIEGFSPSSGNPIPDPAANFTVAASTDQLTMGGPTNAGEGTVLAFSITANAGASGTYWLALKALELAPSGLTECGPDAELFGNLVAGNGQPDYVPPSYLPVCIIPGGSPTFSIPGVGYTVPPGALCFRIISVTNSTQ